MYTKINLKHAYHLIRIHEGDEWKTTFCTFYGTFEWCFMPFSLTNAPAAFQCFMNDIFSNMVNVCILIYLGDILIYSDNMEQHHEHVCKVFQCLQKNHLYPHADKSNLHTNSMEYLGYMLSLAGLSMANYKVKTIQKWPKPCKVKDIQSFLGFANIYQRFIFNYSNITIPLTHLTRKGIVWNFTPECRKCYEVCKIKWETATLQGIYLLVRTSGKGTNLPLPLKLLEGLRPAKQYFDWMIDSS